MEDVATAVQTVRVHAIVPGSENDANRYSALVEKGETVGQWLTKVKLADYVLSRGKGTPFLDEGADLFEQAKQGSKFYATPKPEVG